MGMKVYSRRRLSPEVAVGAAPKGYRWVDYIENTSNAYINTGCYADGTIKIEMVMENVANSAYRGILGTSRTGNPKFGLDQHASSTETATYFYGNASSRNVGIITIGTKTTIEIDGATLKRNGTAYTASGTWSGGALTNPIFVFREYTGATSCALMRLYSLMIWIGGVLLRDYLPIQRLSDGEVGLWDKVEGRFYTSPNGTNFVCGGVNT